MTKLFSILTITFLTYYQSVSFPANDSENQPDDRLPYSAPGKCAENELMYPVKTNDWVCDCGPGYIYYRPKDKCFPAYRQGPCAKNNHLIWQKNKSECVTNPCQEGFAKLKNKCYELGRANGPCPEEEGGGVLEINATTLAVECLKGHDPLSLINVPKNCPRGSRRDGNGQCQESWR